MKSISTSSSTSTFPLDSPDGFQKSINKYRSDQFARGEELEKRAEKNINGSSIFGCICGSNYRSAAMLYSQAADCYKSSKSWDKAAKVYLKLADCYLKLGGYSKHQAAMAYVDAGDIYKKISAKDAISCFSQAVNQLLENGSFLLAGFKCEEIGKLYEVEQYIEKAMVYFERAAELFQSEEPIGITSADWWKRCNQCKQKVAQFSAQLEQYPRAIEIYEDSAKQSLNKNLSTSSVTGYLLNAGLCQFCKADAVALSDALERYEELDPTFPGTRECKFLADLAASVAEENVQKFTEVVKKFDSLTKQDSLKTTLLMRIEEKLKAKEMEKMVQHSNET